MSANDDFYRNFEKKRKYIKEYVDSLRKEGTNIRGMFFNEEFVKK